jgi:hypothetical protein
VFLEKKPQRENAEKSIKPIIYQVAYSSMDYASGMPFKV